jgi:hypothetical protein
VNTWHADLGRSPICRLCTLQTLGAAPLVPTPTPSQPQALTPPKPQPFGASPRSLCPPRTPHLNSQNCGHLPQRGPMPLQRPRCPLQGTQRVLASIGYVLPGTGSPGVQEAPDPCSRGASLGAHPGPGKLGLSRSPRPRGTRQPARPRCVPKQEVRAVCGRSGPRNPRNSAGSRAWGSPAFPLLASPCGSRWQGKGSYLAAGVRCGRAGTGLSAAPRSRAQLQAEFDRARPELKFRTARAGVAALRSPRTFNPSRAENPSPNPPLALPWRRPPHVARPLAAFVLIPEWPLPGKEGLCWGRGRRAS